MKIGLISDTHSYLGDEVYKYFESCDEVWHIGDFGNEVADKLERKYTLRGVYGNIDDIDVRSRFPEYLCFELVGVRFILIHIGGYPGKYSKKSRELIKEFNPDVHIAGHSHVCKAMKDEKNNLIHLNPGAAGKHGFHSVRTIMTFTLEKSKLKKLKVIELGSR